MLPCDCVTGDARMSRAIGDSKGGGMPAGTGVPFGGDVCALKLTVMGMNNSKRWDHGLNIGNGNYILIKPLFLKIKSVLNLFFVNLLVSSGKGMQWVYSHLAAALSD